MSDYGLRLIAEAIRFLGSCVVRAAFMAHCTPDAATQLATLTETQAKS